MSSPNGDFLQNYDALKVAERELEANCGWTLAAWMHFYHRLLLESLKHVPAAEFEQHLKDKLAMAKAVKETA